MDNYYLDQPDLNEAKDKETNVIPALVDLSQALAKVFKKYSRKTRHDAWQALIGSKGQAEVKKLLNNPDRPLSKFRTIRQNFHEWLENPGE